MKFKLITSDIELTDSLIKVLDITSCSWNKSKHTFNTDDRSKLLSEESILDESKLDKLSILMSS